MLIRPSGIGMGSMSGRAGSSVVAVNRGGMYVRNARKNTNPAVTPEQSVVRANLAELSQAWSNALTPEQRDGWTVFANNVPYRNRLGETRFMPPLAAYVRLNGARLQAGLSRLDDAPTNFTDTSLTPPVVTVDDTGTATINFTETDEWNASGGYLLVYASTPQNQTIIFWKNPYRFLGLLTGATTTPQTLTLANAVVDGQRVFFRFVAVAPDGRISTATRALADVTAPPVEISVVSAVVSGGGTTLTITLAQSAADTAGVVGDVTTDTPAVAIGILTTTSAILTCTMDTAVSTGDAYTLDPGWINLLPGFVQSAPLTGLVT